MDQHERATIKAMIRQHGLRPVVNLVGFVVLEMLEDGERVAYNTRESMTPSDASCAASNLVNGDLY